MPLSADQLRQLLTERSDQARHHNAPQEGLAVRIRRARIRRAVGASVMAVGVVIGLVSVANLTREHVEGHGTSYSGSQFPVSFTASDGTSYRRLAFTSLTAPAQRSATIKIKAGAEPIDVMTACDVPDGGFVSISVNGVDATAVACPGPSQLKGLSVRPGQQADITFTQALVLPHEPVVKVDWAFAVYEWKPPATARPAPKEPRLPSSYTSYNTATGHGMALRRLIASRSGVWPADRTATFTVTFRRNLDISVICSGAIADRLQVIGQIDGLGSIPVTCSSWTPGEPLPQNGGGPSGRVGVPLTMTFRIQSPDPYVAADYAKRAASWTIGIYEEDP